MQSFFNIALPVLAPVAVGYALGRFKGYGPERLTELCLYLLMPLLMFCALTRTSLTPAQASQFVIWYFSFVLLAWILTTAVTRLLGEDQPTRSALALSMSSVNVGSYGVPVVSFALGEPALGGILLLFALNNVAAGSVGVYIAAGGRRGPLEALASVFKLPLIYTVALALLLRALGIPIPAGPVQVGQQIGMLGPLLGLVILGIQVSRIHLDGMAVGYLSASIAAKLLLGPLLGIGIIALLDIQQPVRNTLLVCACLPTAINALLLAVKFDARPNLVGAILVGCTLLSPITIGAALLFFGD